MLQHESRFVGLIYIMALSGMCGRMVGKRIWLWPLRSVARPPVAYMVCGQKTVFDREFDVEQVDIFRLQ